MNLVVEISIGLVAGMLAGMLGIGGAIILIPGMVLLLGVEQHTAQGISLGVMSLTALAGSLVHYRLHHVNLKVVLWIAPAAIVFVLLGGWLANRIEALWLTRAFGMLMLFAAARMMLAK